MIGTAGAVGSRKDLHRYKGRLCCADIPLEFRSPTRLTRGNLESFCTLTRLVGTHTNESQLTPHPPPPGSFSGLTAWTYIPRQVKGKTSKVDVYAPSLAIDVAAALALRPPPPSASHLSGGGLSLAAAAMAAGSSPVVGSAAPAPVPPGIILGGLGGGGISRRIPPPPLAPAADGLLAVAAPPPAVQASGGGGSAARGRGALFKNAEGGDGDPSLDDSSRYRLESPRKGNWQGGARRGSVLSADGSVGGK